MKNLILLFTALIFGASSAMAVTVEDKVAERNAYNYNNSFIFIEDGITFSVYPDGEFDFYIDERNGVSANVNFRNVNVTYNSGYDYNPYVQYDDYGAVLQVENVPIYYDYYGRVSQVGNVDISYNRGRVNRLGGLYVYYNRDGAYSHHNGFINVYNRHYVYRPFHNYFSRPAVGLCLVYNSPYRRYYEPVRYTYYKPYYNNYRKSYAKFGKEHKYKKDHYRKSDVYRNDRRVVARDNDSRRNDGYRTSGNVIKRSESRNVDYARNGNSNRSERPNYDSRRSDGRNVSSSNNTKSSRSERPNYDSGRSDGRNVNSSNNTKSRRTNASNYDSKRSSDRNMGDSRSSRSTVEKTVTRKEVSRTPRNTTVTRSSTSYKKPEGRSTGMTETSRSQKTVSSKPNSSKSSRSTQVTSRTSAPSRAGKAASGNKRSGVSTSRGRSSKDL